MDTIKDIFAKYGLSGKDASRAGIPYDTIVKHCQGKQLMDDLSSAWRKTDAPTEPATDDDGWVHTLQIVFDELEALGLSKPVPKPEPKKRGRKPKPKDPTEQKPKRKRGRPRKDASPSADTL